MSSIPPPPTLFSCYNYLINIIFRILPIYPLDVDTFFQKRCHDTSAKLSHLQLFYAYLMYVFITSTTKALCNVLFLSPLHINALLLRTTNSVRFHIPAINSFFTLQLHIQLCSLVWRFSRRSDFEGTLVEFML